MNIHSFANTKMSSYWWQAFPLRGAAAHAFFDPGDFYGRPSPVQGSFGVKELGEIRETAAQGAAQGRRRGL